MNELANQLQQVILKGDLRTLSDQDKLIYYKNVCESIGINPLTKPFDYIVLNNKQTLYATENCTDQLRSLHKISITIKEYNQSSFIIEECLPIPVDFNILFNIFGLCKTLY